MKVADRASEMNADGLVFLYLGSRDNASQVVVPCARIEGWTDIGLNVYAPVCLPLVERDRNCLIDNGALNSGWLFVDDANGVAGVCWSIAHGIADCEANQDDEEKEGVSNNRKAN